MFDEHLNRQHRLSYLARGPEWAFAIPQDDFEALEDVMQRCSTFWNGVNSLLVPVSRDGRLNSSLEGLLRTRPVDQYLMHEGLVPRARQAVIERFPEASPLHEHFNEGELHPLLLAPAPSPTEPKPSLAVPRAASTELRRIVLAAWGYLPDEDFLHWQERFEVAEFYDEAALAALVSAQTGAGTSPLLLTRQHMSLVSQVGPQQWPYLYVFARASFGDLVTFWNFRSRVLADVRGMSVIGVPKVALRASEGLRSLPAWLSGPPDLQRSPDVFVASAAALRDEVDAALRAAGLDHHEGEETRFLFGTRVEPRERPTYRYQGLAIGGPMVRGAQGSTLIAIADGRSSLALSQPQGLDVRTGHNVRLVLRELPLPLPLTQRGARRVHEHASATDGAMLTTGSYGEWNLDIGLPRRFEALADWAADHGFEARLTQAGRYAEALLDRLGDLGRLDVLASELRLSVLEKLAPISRVKLAQRLRAELAREDGIDEELLVERLQEVGLFLEIEARPATDLSSMLGRPLREVLGAVAPLVDAGFIARGQTVACPQCNYRTFFRLADLDETISCPACRNHFTVPITEPSGRREPPLAYRLDGLMARAMDQDLVPVLLALRVLRHRAAGRLFFAWPGVEFSRGGEAVDVDLLCFNQSFVVCCEVKASAPGLSSEQLGSLLQLTEALGARPGLAALRGSFETSLAEAIQSRGGPVYQRGELLG